MFRKKGSRTMIKGFWFAISIAVLLSIAFLAVPPVAVHSQDVTQKKQAGDSTEPLVEAARLTTTVVKLFKEEKFDEALPLAKKALQLREAALAPDHELVQSARLNLAEIYTAMKKYGEAQKLVEQLLKTYELKVGPDDPGAAIFLEKLGFLAYLQRDFGKSEAAYKRSLAIKEKAFGKDSAEFATSLYMLAEFYRFREKFDLAEPLYEHAAVLRRKLLGRTNQEYLKTKDRYFCLAYLTHQPERAKEFAVKLGDDPTKQAGFGEILNGQALSLPRPVYSDEARRQGARGTVIIKVTIDETGKVTDAADMCSGDPLLVKPALESALKARFTPTKLSGQPVKVSGVVTYNFVIR
jgi:TonB family protein